jgi:RNA:NAD 2'-phosphotransferase (TPT1/KptA family)
VFHGNATRTSGRLTKDDLIKTKAGRIVSKKRHEAGKNALRYLHAKGYIAVKGVFGCAKKNTIPDTTKDVEQVVVNECPQNTPPDAVQTAS